MKIHVSIQVTGVKVVIEFVMHRGSSLSLAVLSFIVT